MKLVPDEKLLDGWQCYDWRNAKIVLENGCTAEWDDILEILGGFRIKHTDLAAKGKGNKTAMASAIDSQFYKRGWEEKQFHTAIKVDEYVSETPTHDIDCFRPR